nr:MAG TPA: hypothetical protein [Caudoviricetes sp.]
MRAFHFSTYNPFNKDRRTTLKIMIFEPLFIMSNYTIKITKEIY